MFCRRWVDWKSIASELEATTHALQGQGVRARQVGDNSRVFFFVRRKSTLSFVSFLNMDTNTGQARMHTAGKAQARLLS